VVVVRRRHEHRVVADVGLEVGRLVLGPRHRFEGRLDRRQLLGRRALGCEADGGRFDDLPNLEHAPEALRVQAGLGEPSEQMPVGPAGRAITVSPKRDTYYCMIPRSWRGGRGTGPELLVVDSDGSDLVQSARIELTRSATMSIS